MRDTRMLAVIDCPRPRDERAIVCTAADARIGEPESRACDDCGAVLGARCAMEAVIRACDGAAIAVVATDTLGLFSTGESNATWPVPWIHSLAGNAPAVAAGAAAAVRVRARGEVRVVVHAGRAATTEVGFGCLAASFERNDDVLYICYDDEAWPDGAAQRWGGATATAHGAGSDRLPAAQPSEIADAGRNVPLLAMAHRIAYAATASVGHRDDLAAKVTRAATMHGARYIHVHAPCPPAWGATRGETERLARLAVACGLFPLFESRDGVLTGCTAIDARVPVAEYLKAQSRFCAAAANDPDAGCIARIQAIADRNIARFRLA